MWFFLIFVGDGFGSTHDHDHLIHMAQVDYLSSVFDFFGKDLSDPGFDVFDNLFGLGIISKNVG